MSELSKELRVIAKCVMPKHWVSALLEAADRLEELEPVVPNPCPRCKGEGRHLSTRTCYWVTCIDANCHITGPTGGTPEAAIAEWNRLRYEATP